MSPFALNLLLTLVWMAVSGSFSLANLLLGFTLALLVVAFVAPALSERDTGYRVVRFVALGWLFLQELARSNVRVARDVLRPRFRFRPGIVAVPLDATSNAEITLFANMVTLTPGTLSLDVHPDRTVLWVHAMDVRDPDALRAALKSGFERRILEALR